MKVAVLANGEWDPEWGKTELADAGYLICADGGADSALLTGRMPDVLIGDLDSVTPDSLNICQMNNVLIECYPREKDETDLQLALNRAEHIIREAEREGCSDAIWVYGATGGRIDHLLGNLSLALAFARRGRRLRFEDPRQELWIVLGREEITGTVGQQVSLITLSERACVSTEGFYYRLDHGELFQDAPMGVSNVLIAEKGVIEVHQGWVFVIVNS